MSELEKVRFNYKIWLETADGENLFGEGICDLLKAIKATNSLKQGIEKKNWSYRKTWDRLRKIENTLGMPLIKTSTGGAEGGKTELTETGEKLIEALDNFYQEYDQIIRKQGTEIFKKILSDK